LSVSQLRAKPHARFGPVFAGCQRSPLRAKRGCKTKLVSDAHWKLRQGEPFMQVGPMELVIVLVIVLLLFGVGRIGKIAGELGSGVRSFRQGLKDPDEAQAEAATDKKTEKDR
jgi:sec-independent protein translocase protein TatA